VIKFDLNLQPALTENEVKELALGSDANGDGLIDWKEFLDALVPKLKHVFESRGGADWVALTELEGGNGDEYLYW
jgi:hypothetical protein